MRVNRPDLPQSALREELVFIAGSAAVRRNAGGRMGGSELNRKALMILSAMEAAVDSKLPRMSAMERRLRRSLRTPFHARAELILAADGSDADPWLLFIRDVDGRAMGFITPDRLPLGSPGLLSFTSPSGRSTTLPVTLSRCRSSAAGWYEGSLHFARPQPWLVKELG